MTNFINLDKILTFFNYVFWFLTLNIIFLILNAPLVFFFVFVGISSISTYLPLFLICAIPFGVSFTSLIYCMDKLLKNKEIAPIKDYFKSIKSSFFNSTIIWIVELFIVFMLYTNIKFFTSIGANIAIKGFFTLLLLIILCITPYIFILTGKFSMNILSTIKSATILTITRPISTVSNILCLLVTLVIFEINPATTFLFIGSIATFLIVFVNRILLGELEARAVD